MYFNQKRVNLLNDGVSGSVCFLSEGCGLSCAITLSKGDSLGLASLIALNNDLSTSLSSYSGRRSNLNGNSLAFCNRSGLNSQGVSNTISDYSGISTNCSTVLQVVVFHLVVYVNEQSINGVTVVSVANNVNVHGVVAGGRLISLSNRTTLNTLSVLGVNVYYVGVLAVDLQSRLNSAASQLNVDLLAVYYGYSCVAANIFLVQILQVFDLVVAYNIVLNKVTLFSVCSGRILEYSNLLGAVPDLVLPYLVTIRVGDAGRGFYNIAVRIIGSCRDGLVIGVQNRNNLGVLRTIVVR